jgi:hypothetical protein
MADFSPRAAWFLGVDLGALAGLLVLTASTRSPYASLSWPVSMVVDWLLLIRVGKEQVHRVQFTRGVLQGYLVPVSIGLVVFVAVAVYYMLTRGTLRI